jgi:fructuronate reductase
VNSTELPRLSRSRPGVPDAAPVRIVHLGIGNFHRAHQAWYTTHAPDAAAWGIAGFTGRRPDMADALAPQDGLYTLITRSAATDTFEIISAVSAVHRSTDHDRYLDYLRQPEVAIVTITVTEPGYLRGPDGRLIRTDAVRADIAALRDNPSAPVQTLPGKLVAGLLARRTADAGPITLLSCDNLPHNGDVTRTVVTELAAAVDESLLAWVASNVDFASSMVDRITPASTEADREAVAAAQGYHDASPVATEPFSEWVVAGRFPAGRPQWEAAGVTIVDDAAPFEQRKLWLLNGSHSLLAYAGSVRGYQTIDEAIGDSACRGWVEQLWDEASPHLSLPPADIAAYREALITRYTNPRIRHLLAQIAADGSVKLAVRTLPVARAERSAGRMPLGCAATLGSWVLHLRGGGAPVRDVEADRFVAAAANGDLDAGVQAVLSLFDADLGRDADFVDAVRSQAHAVSTARGMRARGTTP